MCENSIARKWEFWRCGKGNLHRRPRAKSENRAQFRWRRRRRRLRVEIEESMGSQVTSPRCRTRRQDVWYIRACVLTMVSRYIHIYCIQLNLKPFERQGGGEDHLDHDISQVFAAKFKGRIKYCNGVGRIIILRHLNV